MSDLIISALKFLGILFGILLLAFTGYQTWSLLYEVTANPLISTLGLVVFEGGMLYWWFFFQKSAKGLSQLGLSVLMFAFCLLLVGGATALHLGAITAETFGADTPAKLITIAVILNLVAKMLMPLLHPDTLLLIKSNVAEAKIMDKAFKRLETKADDISEKLAQDMSDDMLMQLQQNILAGRSRPKLIEGEAHHVDQNGRRTPLTAFEPHHLTDEPSFMERFSAWIAGQESDQEIETPTPTTAEQTSPAGPDSDEQQPDPLPPNGRTK